MRRADVDLLRTDVQAGAAAGVAQERGEDGLIEAMDATVEPRRCDATRLQRTIAPACDHVANHRSRRIESEHATGTIRLIAIGRCRLQSIERAQVTAVAQSRLS